MKYLIVHLSDMHFTAEKLSKILFKKRMALLNAINRTKDIEKHIIFIISGDITNSGSKDEFKEAYSFLSYLRNRLIENGNNVSFILSPGNHDCNIDGQDPNMIDERNKVIDKLNDGIAVDLFKFNKEFNVLENYHKFKKGLVSSEYLENERILFDQYLYDSIGYNLSILSCNSSYFSKRKETQGKIILPSNEIEDNYWYDRDHFNISTFHHPFEWFNRDDNFYKIITTKSDVVFTGHEHSIDTQIIETPESKYLHIRGGEFHHKERIAKSAFNLVKIDTETAQAISMEFSLDGGSFQLINELIFDAKEKVYDNGIVKLKHSFYIKEINKNDIFLRENDRVNDLFVEFRFQKEMNDLVEQEDDELIDYKVLISEIELCNDKNYYNFTGGEGYGKSLLAARLFNNLYFNGKVPILIHGSNFQPSKTNLNYLKNYLCSCFKVQYNENDDKFYDLLLNNNKKIFLIIDDYHYVFESAFSPKINLLLKISEIVSNIIIMTNNEFNLNRTQDLKNQAKILDEFVNLSILPFNNQQKYKLIEKWTSCKNQDNEAEIFRKNYYILEKLNQLLNNKLVPASPRFILIFLKACDEQESNELIYGAKAHFYKYLVNTALLKITNECKIDADFIQTYLSELAYFLYKNGLKRLSEEVYTEFHEMLIEEYGYTRSKLENDSKKMLIYLNENNMFTKEGIFYKFTYKFIYYYFTASYFASNIYRNMEILDILINNIHLEDNANIVLFFISLSDEKLITDRLISELEKVYLNTKELECSEDIKIFNEDELIKERKLEKFQGTVQHKREEFFKDRDAKERLQDNENYEPNFENKEVREIIRSIKLLDVSGQLLKSYGNSIRLKPRLNVTKASLNLGLRLAKHYLDLIEEVIEFEIEEEANENIEELVEFLQLIKQVSYEILQSLILHIAKVIGNSKMKGDFENILNDKKSNSLELINFAIKLEYYNEFDADYIYKLLKKHENNKMVRNFIISIINHHINIVSVDERELKQLLNKLNYTNINKVKLLQRNKQIAAENKIS